MYRHEAQKIARPAWAEAELFAKDNAPQALCDNYRNHRLWSLEEALTLIEREIHAIKATVYATHLRKHWKEGSDKAIEIHLCSRCAGIEGAPKIPEE